MFKQYSLSASLLPILPLHLMPNIHLLQYVPEALSLPFSNSEKPVLRPIHQREPFLPPLSQQPFTTIKYNSQQLCLRVFITSRFQSKALGQNKPPHLLVLQPIVHHSPSQLPGSALLWDCPFQERCREQDTKVGHATPAVA